MKKFSLLCALLPLLAFAFPITENGKAAVKIVIPDKCDVPCRYAAEELQFHILKVSGAKLEIIRESAAADGNAIHVGPTAEAQKNCPAWKNLPHSGWIVKSTPDKLFLIGSDNGSKISDNTTETGTLYAVYYFLDKHLNIRWLWPDKDTGTFYPQNKNISSGNFDVVDEPSLPSMIIRKIPLDYLRRVSRLRRPVEYYPDNIHGHAFGKYHIWYGKEHPDWFAHREGQKLAPVTSSRSMCVSNPEFHKEIIRRWQAERAKNPGKKITINLCENDTAGECACKRCLSWDDPDYSFSWMTTKPGKNVGARYARFALEVWNLAKEIDPDAQIIAYVYKNYIFAPKNIKLPPNIQLAHVPSGAAEFPRTPAIMKDVLDNLKQWQKTGATINYRPNILGGYAMPENFVSQYFEEFTAHKQGNMKKLDVDGPNLSFATQGPFLYVMCRSLSLPQASLDELLDEYYSCFGSAKAEIKAYWEYWHKYSIDNARMFYDVPRKYGKLRHEPFFGWHYTFYAHILFPEKVLRQGMQLLDKAVAAAKNDPEALKKVLFLKAGLEHAILCVNVCALFENPQATNDSRLRAMETLNKFRKTMPQWAADLKYFTKIGYMENVTWQFSDFDPASMIHLERIWNVMPDPEDVGESKKYFAADLDDSKWQKISTDRHLEKQGLHNYHHAWFRLQVEIPKKFRNQKTILHLGAVDESCKLWINGKFVAEFRYNKAENPDSWQNPMDFDITPFVGADGKVSIALKVTNEIGGGGLWQLSQIRFFDIARQSYVWDEEFLRKNITKARGYNQYLFPVELPDGGFAYRVNGPKLGKVHPFFFFIVPFRFVAGKTYEVNAELFQHCNKHGEVTLGIHELDIGKKALKYHSLPTKRVQDKWLKLNYKFTATADTMFLKAIYMAWNVQTGDYGMIKSMSIKEVEP